MERTPDAVAIVFAGREVTYRRLNENANQLADYLGTLGVGMAFGAGWTPCIGPVLATVLAVAASEDSVARGVQLLFVYSLGLGIPFVLAAVAIRPFLSFMNRFKRHLGTMEKVMGILLVIPIGGADMPVVISLLNSLSGVAAAMAGFVIGNQALIIGGALVGVALGLPGPGLRQGSGLFAGDAGGEAAFGARRIPGGLGVAEDAPAALELAGQADGLIWEHYDSTWQVDWDYNKQDAKHLFRPWGFQPGHQTEWSKLLLTLYTHRPESWLTARAGDLFDRALEPFPGAAEVWAREKAATATR